MYQVGDIVVHPMHGSGKIKAVVTQRNCGREQDYYVFSIPTGGLELFIPVESAEAIGVRNLIGVEQANVLMHSFSIVSNERCTNWSKRYRDNLERLKSGDLNQVVEVLKTLLLRDYQQGLSTGERKMLYMAKQIFITEIAVVIDDEYEAVEKAICQSVRAAIK
ncbi:CarD family transcriptional regulator [Bengtsoniella intestinalis]|uniref:CarD family transcriptional regulator n=1 Tax=Bengtsoniella intestinalis TaxID=3073143 RepID=UPI00391F9FB6